MHQHLNFKAYNSQYQEACLSVFDENCPEFFAPNERQDYLDFLAEIPDGYEVCLVGDDIAGAWGLCGEQTEVKAINWIMISAKFQGAGVGKAMMTRAIELARNSQVATITIAASHLSAPFFARFNAVAVKETPNGWGEGMHRIDMVLTV